MSLKTDLFGDFVMFLRIESPSYRLATLYFVLVLKVCAIFLKGRKLFSNYFRVESIAKQYNVLLKEGNI